MSLPHQERSGWITFAGVAALIAGAYNALSGIAALSDDDTLTAQAQEVLYGIDLTAWGWFWLIVGLVQLLAGVLILQRNMWGLWLGVGIACLSALMAVLVMFVFPLWAIAVLTIDFLVLFALLTESDTTGATPPRTPPASQNPDPGAPGGPFAPTKTTSPAVA